MSPLIELENLVKDYGTIRALNGVNLAIQPGITGLLGPNGAGKSTLIKVLLGLLRTTSGRGQVLGYELGKQNREIRARVGYMPEDDCFLPGISGVESVQFMARLSQFPSKEGLRRAHEILDFCGAGQERYRPVETYSTGMRQKLRFAQTLVHDPPLLILDEPTSGLDPAEREATLNRIRILSTKHGKAVLLCTHILPDVQAISDSVVILSKGTVQVSDRLENLNRSQTPSVQIRVVGPVDEFYQALSATGCQVARQESGTLTVAGTAADVADTIWATADQCRVAIRSLVPSRTSLEEIFLAAVRGESHGTA